MVSSATRIFCIAAVAQSQLVDPTTTQGPEPVDSTTTVPGPVPLDPTTTAANPEPLDPTTTVPGPVPLDPTTTAANPEPLDPTTTAAGPEPFDPTTTLGPGPVDTTIAPGPEPVDTTTAPGPEPVEPTTTEVPQPSPTAAAQIQSIVNSLCLDLPGGETSNGALLWMWECYGGETQQWSFQDNQLVYLPDTTKCVDLLGGDTGNGNQLGLWDCYNGDSQQWHFDSDAGTISLVSDSTKCIDVDPWAETGDRVQIWDCNGLTQQTWKVGGEQPPVLALKGNPALDLIEGLSKGLFNDETLSNCIGHVAKSSSSLASSIKEVFTALRSKKPLKIAKAIKDLREALKGVTQEMQDCGANLQEVKDLVAALKEMVPAVVGEFASAKVSLNQGEYQDFGEHLGKAVNLLISSGPLPPPNDADLLVSGNPALEVVTGLSDGLFGDHALSECVANALENTGAAKSVLSDLTTAVKSKNILKIVKAIKELKQVVKSFPESLKPCNNNIEDVKSFLNTLQQVGSMFVDDIAQAFQSLKAHDLEHFGEYIGKAMRIVAYGDEPEGSIVVV